MTATTNQLYVEKAIQGALADFDRDAGPSHINDPLFALSCRLLELSHAAPDMLSEADAEATAGDRARLLGHDNQSIRDTWKSALRHVGGQAAVIPQPTHANGHAAHSAGFSGLAAFEAARGLPAGALAAMGWADAELIEYEYTDPKTGKAEVALTDQELLVHLRRRRALRFETDAGPRWRLIDADKPRPKYWHRHRTHLDSNKAWYRLTEALALAAQTGYLALANGEIAVCVAQHWGVPAVCETGGGEKTTPAQMLSHLRAVWQGPILIPADADAKGRKASAAKRQQYLDAGYTDVRVLDLQLAGTDDLADWCALRQAASAHDLPGCPDLAGPTSPAPAQAGQTGQVTQSQAIIAQLARLGYQFRRNECGLVLELNGRPMSDDDAAEMRTALRDVGWKRFGAVEDAIAAHAKANAYHPVRDYLAGLAWDGADRIAQLATHLRGENPIVTYQDGATCPLESVYLHRWLIGAVAKAIAGEQNAMLVFAGPQGLGKSSFAWWICPPSLREAYHLEAPVNPNDKDHLLRLMHSFVWEVGELDATTRKADISALKHFISQQTVQVRRSYGRYDTRGLALASLIGTVNSGDFLMDDTGNRRFYVIELAELDWAYRQLDVDQIWAEAVARYRRGEPWRLHPEEQAAQAEHNRQFMSQSIVGDYLRRYLLVSRDPAHTMTAADMIDLLRRKDVRLTGTDRALQMDIAALMAALDVPRRKQPGGGRYYVGVLERP